LGQVVMNLVINTCDAIQSNGSSLPERTLTFRMKKDSLHQQGQASTARDIPGIRLEVSDNGPGLTPEIKNRVFEPFVTGAPEGSGLGLSSAYEIINAHQGTITVESTLGQGTIFTILLPLAPHDRPAVNLREMIG
jgi:two-component system NtrC family sensor kinase